MLTASSLNLRSSHYEFSHADPEPALSTRKSGGFSCELHSRRLDNPLNKKHGDARMQTAPRSATRPSSRVRRESDVSLHHFPAHVGKKKQQVRTVEERLLLLRVRPSSARAISSAQTWGCPPGTCLRGPGLAPPALLRPCGPCRGLESSKSDGASQRTGTGRLRRTDGVQVPGLGVHFQGLQRDRGSYASSPLGLANQLIQLLLDRPLGLGSPLPHLLPPLEPLLL